MSVYAKPIAGSNYPAGIAYIALPVDIERADYISRCYKTHTVSIRSEDGAYFNRIPIDEDCLNKVRFPDIPQNLGSPVLYVNEVMKNQLFITNVMPEIDTIGDLIEGQFKIKRKYKSDYVEITGSAKDKFLGITLNTQDSGTTFYINVSNKNKDANLNINVQGNVNVSASNKITATSFSQIEIKTTSSDGVSSVFQQSVDENHFDGKKFTINGGEEAMMLGNQFKTFFNNFLNDLVSIIIDTPAGSGAIDPSSITKLEAYADQLDNLLSQKSFLE